MDTSIDAAVNPVELTMAEGAFLQASIDEIREAAAMQPPRFVLSDADSSEELVLVDAEIDDPQPRLSDHPYDMIVELARIADRLVETRDRLAIEQARADRAERDLTSVSQRMMAARQLLYDAQKVAHESVEQVAYLEGRCSSLEDLVRDLAGRGRFSRWRWKRNNVDYIERTFDN